MILEKAVLIKTQLFVYTFLWEKGKKFRSIFCIYTYENDFYKVRRDFIYYLKKNTPIKYSFNSVFKILVILTKL